MKSIIISSVLSLLLTGNSPVRFQYPNNIISTPYGTCTWYYSLSDLQNSTIGSIFNGMSFSTDAKMTIVNYTFNGQATGTFDLPVYDAVLNSQYKLFVQGGILISVPDLNGDNSPDALRFRVNDTRQFTCLIIHPNWSQPATINLELRNQNITINDTFEGNVADILSYTSSINGYTQTINSSVTTIKNILTQSLGGYVSQDGSLYTDMESIISALNIISNNQSKIVEQIPIYSRSAYTMFIRNGTIQDYYKYGDNVLYIPSFLTNINSQYFNQNYSTTVRNGETYYYIYSTNYYQNGLRIINSSNQVITYYELINADNTNGIKTFILKWNNSSGSDVDISIINQLPIGSYVLPLYSGINPPVDIADLFNFSISNNYTRKMDEIKNAIEDMSLNVNQLTVNATGITYNTNQTLVDNSVTSYENNISIVNNIENNFKTMFDNANQNYNVDNIPITNDMINTNNFMNNIATQLYGINIIKYPVTLLLLGIVLIGLLG